MLQPGYGLPHQFQMEIAYTRSEIGRYTHCLREWEAREKDLHVRYGLAPPMTQSETDTATISLLENRMNAMARDHAGYVDMMNKQMLQQKDLVRERDYVVLSLEKKVEELEAEKKRLVNDYDRVMVLKREDPQDFDQSGDWMESRTSRRTAIIAKKVAKEQVFRNIEGKRKVGSLVELLAPASGKRQKSDYEGHGPLDLSFCIGPSGVEELQQLEPLDQLLNSSNADFIDELKPKIKVWLLLKLGEKFPSCLINNCIDNGSNISTFGIPKYLKDEFLNLFQK